MNEIIVYSDDHRCEPNGVGDYRMICPKVGVVPGFVPFMLRTTQKCCLGCNQVITFQNYDK